ncbi:MAG: metallophosphoesterase [Acutalibacteraceae bacterium]|nr:metallophosphoesterase [Acutalibacteraceae bacterium]
MKKFIAILLTLSLVFSFCAVSASAAEEEGPDISYAVASDLHFNFPDEKLEWFSEDPIYGYANRRAAMENESGLIIDEFLNQCAEDETIQFVLIAGDLADNGKGDYTEHVAVAEKLKEFETKSGKSVYVIPGNHDVCNPSKDDDTDLARFMEIYADFGYDKALTRDLPYASYTADLGEKYRLIALDSNDPSKSTEDGMNDHKVQWVIDQAEQAKKDGRYPILMMHHNLLDHLPMQRLLSHDFIIRNHTITAERWANAGIKLVFSGHEHCSDATTYVSTTGNTISDFATTSLTMYPLQYRYLEMHEDAIIYEARTVDKIDTDALKEMIPDYSDEQLAEMNKGLNAFAKNFLKNGVEWRLERGFLDEQLGIKPGDIYYDLVRDAIDALNGVLNMPLYGKGSAQELGAKYGIEIPDSEYKDGWDVATELVSAHYAGSENYPLSGRDVTLLMRLVSIVLKTELAMVDDMVLTQAATAIVSATLGTEKYVIVENYLFGIGYGPISPGEYFLLAIASPLLQSFANDDGVDDNNGVIDGYGVNNNAENVKENVTISISEFLSYMKMILKFILKGLHVIGQVE